MLAPLDLRAREQEVAAQVLAGNIPNFLRHFCPVWVTNVCAGRTNVAVFYCAPDYLAVGSDADYLLMPLSPATAQHLADALHCCLPTPKMVDRIYPAAAVKLSPTPIPPSPAMTTVGVFSNHNALVRAQRAEQLAASPLGTLVAGHKKDIVITARLAGAPDKVAIYGWHNTNGVPIQPLYLGHSATWVDYSQCIRLVAQEIHVNGTSNTVAAVLQDPVLAGLLTDEGPIAQPRYTTPESIHDATNTPREGTRPTTAPVGRVPPRGAHTVATPHATNAPEPIAPLQFTPQPAFHERLAWLNLEPGVRVQINEPIVESPNLRKKVLLVFYALPNGSTIEQTAGKAVKPGDDWHFGIQHIAAQTRFLRALLPNRELVLVYLENAWKSWPVWRRHYSDRLIPGLLESVQRRLGISDAELVLAGHSGGGSLIFGYLNALERIPDNVERIVFLDSDYAYERAAHRAKLVDWLQSSQRHYLCVLAYNDAVALLDGKPFVSAAGGTWGKSHEMLRDLAGTFAFTGHTNAEFEITSALNGRAQFLLRENPDRKILHTVLVERNGFIHALLTGTEQENRGYKYFGEPAYGKWIENP